MKLHSNFYETIIIISIIAAASVDNCFAKDSPDKAFDNSHYTVINNVQLHYRSWLQNNESHKPWIMLIHGFSGSTYSWRFTADSLHKSSYNVIAIDVPPYGYSDRNPKNNTSTTAIAKLIDDFIKTEFPGKHWHIIGHSMGGGIAQALATLYPENIKTVTFVDGAIYSSIEEGNIPTPYLFRLPFVEGFLSFIGDNFFITKNMVADLLESAYGQEPSTEEIKQYYKALNISGTSLAIIRSKTRSEEIASFKASQINKPVLAIWGEQDSWVPLSQMKSVLKQMPDVQTEVIPACGHNPMETHHEEFMKILLEFLGK